MTALCPRERARHLFVSLLAVAPGWARTDFGLDACIDWDELRRLSLDHQVFPQIYQALKARRNQVPPAQFKIYRDFYAANLLRNLTLQREQQRLCQLLTQSGLGCLVMRGSSLAVRAYGDVGLRVFSDLDLFIAEDLIVPAWTLLEQAGYRADFDVSTSDWLSLARFSCHICLRHRDRGWLVELHWRQFSPHYALAMDHLLNGEGPAVPVEQELVLLAAHGAKHVWQRLKWVLDLDRLIRSADDLDWPRVETLARDCGSLRMLLVGLLLAEKIDTLEPLPERLRDLMRRDRAARWLAEQIWQWSFARREGQRRLGFEYGYQLVVRERWSDRLRLSWRWPFWPRPDDWLRFPVARKCLPLLLCLRPLRWLTAARERS